MNQERTIMGACDYSIESLRNIKKALMDQASPHKESNWAQGGLILTLTSHLLRISHETILEAAKNGEMDAKKEVLTIQSRFNEFVDQMINNA